jgi:hypothetical protein
MQSKINLDVWLEIYWFCLWKLLCMLMMSSILSVLHACNMHVTQQMQQFSLSTMPTSTSLFLFCFLHGRCDDLFSIATTMHNHTPRQPTAPSSSWLCQPKDSKAMPRKATLRCYHRPNHREVLGFHLEVSLKSETLTMPSRRKIIPMTSSSLANGFGPSKLSLENMHSTWQSSDTVRRRRRVPPWTTKSVGPTASSTPALRAA